MSVETLKRADKRPATGEEETRRTVASLLDDIERGGEATALDCARRLDGWDGPVVVSSDAIAAAEAALPQALKDDIRYAHDRVRRFAEHQRQSMSEFEVELEPGFRAGQKLIPMTTVGCYVPGGRYAHVASAIMSVTTARVAGVRNVIACSPPRRGEGIPASVLYALHLCGADRILVLGGVQGIAALTFGLFTGHPADMLVGPGNQYVAEAKRLLFGRVGIDMFAGPSEIGIIADHTADPRILASDLVGQAEHGPNSPAWLVATDRRVAEETIRLVPGLIEGLPEPNRGFAAAAWREYGEVTLCDSREEAAEVSDGYAPEHLEVHAADPDWWLGRLVNYGSLFLGEETTVAFGDKASGPNHILPTKGAARYTGGLSVGKFLKTVTYQRMTRDANRELAAVTARLSRLEGMEAHARTADDRLAKYFPGQDFRLEA